MAGFLEGSNQFISAFNDPEGFQQRQRQQQAQQQVADFAAQQGFVAPEAAEQLGQLPLAQQQQFLELAQQQREAQRQQTLRTEKQREQEKQQDAAADFAVQQGFIKDKGSFKLLPLSQQSQFIKQFIQEPNRELEQARRDLKFFRDENPDSPAPPELLERAGVVSGAQRDLKVTPSQPSADPSQPLQPAQPIDPVLQDLDPLAAQIAGPAPRPPQPTNDPRFDAKRQKDFERAQKVHIERAKKARELANLTPKGQEDKALQKAAISRFENQQKALGNAQIQLKNIENAIRRNREVNGAVLDKEGNVTSFSSPQTGRLQTGFGLFTEARKLDKNFEKLDTSFQQLALQEMITKFAGMSRAIDTEADRLRFEATVASVRNDPETNEEILQAQKALAVKIIEEAKRQRAWVKSGKSLADYQSPLDQELSSGKPAKELSDEELDAEIFN